MSIAKKYLENINLLFNNSKKDVVISDLDGCLCPIEGRLDFINKLDWDGFHKASFSISPSKWCLEILNGLKNKYGIIFITGRPIKYESETKKWLLDYCGFDEFDYMLYMRDTDDFDYRFKEHVYNSEIKDKYNVLFIIEDRPKVVQMWRKHGLICLQPNFYDV